MSQEDLDIIQSDAGLVADVRTMIEQTREAVARTVNAGMTLLYWRIGKRILTEVLGNQRAEYGKEIVQSLSTQLTDEFGSGFTAKVEAWETDKALVLSSEARRAKGEILEKVGI